MNLWMTRKAKTAIRHVLTLFCVVFIVGAIAPVSVSAQEYDSAGESDDRAAGGGAGDETADEAEEGTTGDDGDGEGRGATTFEPAPEEQVSGLGLMVAAYMAIWVLLIGYFVVLYNRQKKIGRDLDELKLRVDALDDLD